MVEVFFPARKIFLWLTTTGSKAKSGVLQVFIQNRTARVPNVYSAALAREENPFSLGGKIFVGGGEMHSTSRSDQHSEISRFETKVSHFSFFI